MPYIQPAQGQLLSFTLMGYDMTQYVHCVRVYEDICKPYLTAEIEFYDTNNIIENLNVTAGCPAGFSFHSPPNGNTYTQNLVVLDYKGEQAPGTLKYQIYTFHLIGTVYFQDRSNNVQAGFTNQTGTSAIQQIFGQYLPGDTLSVITQSAGMIGTTSAPYNTNEHPLTAINNIMRKLTASQYQTGNWLLYRDSQNVKLAQLQQLFDQGSSVQSFIQKETWGVNFNDADLYRAIIVAQVLVQGSAADIAGAMNQTQRTFDISAGSPVGNMLGGQIASGIGGIFSQAQAFISMISSGTVMTGHQLTDSARWPNSTAPFTKTNSEASYSATIRNSPQLLIRVPMQTGLNVTIGQKITAQLMPPTGDLFNVNPYQYSLYGDWLAIRIVHEIYTDQREDSATTTIVNYKGTLS